MPKLWMSGVGTLCAIAHYRDSLFSLQQELFQGAVLIFESSWSDALVMPNQKGAEKASVFAA